MANSLQTPQGMQITGEIAPGFETILTPQAPAARAKRRKNTAPILSR